MKRFLLPFICILVFSSCNNPQNKSCCVTPVEASGQQEEYKFVHTVFFWLKEGTTGEEKSEFEKGMLQLGTTESIGKYYMGIPADTDRDVIDSSYDYAWIVHFADGQAQEEYQKDSIHLDFIEKYSHLWEKVRVFDTDIKASH